MGRPIAAIVLVALWAASAVGPARAGSLGWTGDGSGTNNPDLMRRAVDGMDGACSDCDPGPSISSLDDPFFDLDWSLALRGSYVEDSSIGSYFAGSAIPSFTLSHTSLRSSLSLSGSAEIVRSSFEQYRLASLRLSVAGDYLVDQATTFNAGIDFSLSRAAADAPGNPPGVIESPLVLQGTANASLQHRIGMVDVTLRANGARVVNGPTTLVGPVLQDNSWQNTIEGGGGARIGVRMSPILTLFADVGGNYQYFEGPSPTLLVKYDGPSYALKAGLAARWATLLAAEVSLGYGLRQYDSPALPDVGAILYDGRVTFTPDESWVFNAGFSTTLSPPGSSGNGRIIYALTGDARYRVNPWLALRAKAGWSQTNIIGTGTIENTYVLNLGSDYAVNDNTTFTADYTLEKRDSPARTIQSWMLGVTFAK